MSRIESIITEIEDFLAECKPAAFSSSKIVINKEELEGLLVELRQEIPDEVKQYQKIISNRNAILNDAKAKSDGIIAEANKMTEQLVEEHEIMQKAYANAQRVLDDAKKQGQRIVDDANDQANAIKMSSIRYTDDMLKSLQTIIQHALDGTQKSYQNMMSTLEANYNIITSNRSDLMAGIGEQSPYEEQQQYEQQDEEGSLELRLD